MELQLKQLFKFQMKIFTNIIISMFYVGYFTKYPGTLASFISILILFPIIEFSMISSGIFIGIFFLIFFISLIFIKKYSEYTETHDSKKIVIDEFLGIYLILIFYNVIFIYNDILTIFLIFILFRFFDILKIFPANIIDKKMDNALGVILDDLVASIYTIIVLLSVNVFTK